MRLARVLSAAAVFAGCFALSAADKEFKEVVRAVSAELNAKPMHIPLMGLVNAVTFVARPAGARHMDFAVFENVNNDDHDGREIARRIRKAVGEDKRPFVQTFNHDDLSMVYLQPDGKNVKLLVATVGSNDATVIELKLNPDALARWLQSPTKRIWEKDHDDDREP